MEAIKDYAGYYIKFNKGRPERVSNINLASKFDNGKAQIYINNQIGKKSRDNFNVEVIGSNVKPVVDTLSSMLTDKCDLSSYIDNCDIDMQINNFTDFLQEIKACRSYLEDKLSEIEQERCDIEHAIEFYKYNACEGFKMYKMLHEVRCKRREIKDKLIKIDIINESTLDDWYSGRVLRRIEGLQNRKYEPRVLKELFVECGI